MRRPSDKGVVLTVVIVIIIVLASLTLYVTTLTYNQKKLADSAGGRRSKVYYRAQAGVIDANWRIRTNYTAGIPVGNFRTNPNYSPTYSIDVDGDGTNDCQVTIGAVDASGKRPITSQGLDV